MNKLDNDIGKNTEGRDYLLNVKDYLILVEMQKSADLYATRKRLLEYYKYFLSLEYKTEETKKLSKKVFDFLCDDYRRLKTSIKEDLNELDDCYSVGAYKATVILAGSILEAFLLDWLSEIDGKNYFVEPYQIRVLKKDGTYKWEKREQLSVYIDQIKEIKKPEWMESSEKAHFIRQSRNNVHAKVCIKGNYKIDEEMCKKVISYLTEIIDNRLESRRKELNL